MANDQWSGQDKAQHFIASAMLAAAGNEYAQHQGNSRDRSAAIGLMFSINTGASKSCGTAVPLGAAGAGRTSHGMLLERLPAMLSGNWHITRGADLSPSHAALAILKRNYCQRSDVPEECRFHTNRLQGQRHIFS